MINKGSLKKLINDEYDAAFDKMVTIDISAVAEAIEKKTFLLIEDILHGFTNQLIPNSRSVEDRLDKKILLGSVAYSIRVQEPWDSPDSIIVAYVKLYAFDRKINNPKTRTIKIDGIGKYKQFTLITPESMSIDIEGVSEIIKTIFETSYSWLFQKIRKVVKGSHMVTSNLYTRLKISLENKSHIYSTVWFVVQHKDQCIVLLDSDNIEKAMKSLSSNLIHPDTSPYKLLDQFINMRLPFDKAFAKQALKKGACVNGVINKGKYTNDLPLLAAGQIQIFTPEVSVFPVITEGRNHLYASFPTKFRGDVEPILLDNQEFLINEFKSFNSRIKRLIKSLDNHKIDVTRIAEFLGVFAGTYTNTILKS
ncbi:hypothetical protein [uncultured Psychroserpens sp.]|uniref:hypothetical protein n=1 Tax=uncultured Psychroserpens sp. TaxID=255436 RepID=UPI0026286A76|nr:hypothetical protein [uncultured Psychroserpens sp.]